MTMGMRKEDAIRRKKMLTKAILENTDMNASEIASNFGVPCEAVSRLAKKLGIDMKSRGYPSTKELRRTTKVLEDGGCMSGPFGIIPRRKNK